MMKRYERKVQNASTTPASNQHRNKNSLLNDDPDPVLMQKLGIFLSDKKPVKTTTHLHPVLSHEFNLNPGKREFENKLSGQEKRVSSQPLIYAPIPKDPKHQPNLAKTGSLNSRKLLPQTPMSQHTQSSPDITEINGNSASNQPHSPLWNNDPRRNSISESPPSNITSLIISRKLSAKRQNAGNDSLYKDAAVKKLPQLFRLSPSHSSRSSAASSLRSLPLPEEDEEHLSFVDHHSFESSLADRTLVENDLLQSCNVIINTPTPPTPNSLPPPLPPKVSQRKQPSSYNNPAENYLDKTAHHMDYLSLPSYRHAQQSQTQDETWLPQTRPRVASDGALRKRLGDAEPSSDITSKNNELNHSNISNYITSHQFHQANSRVHMKSLNSSGNPAFVESRNQMLHHQAGRQQYDSREVLNTGFNRSNMQRSSLRSIPGGFKQQRPPSLFSKPLQFCLHHAIESETIFAGRDWLFSKILTELNGNNVAFYKGVVIHGGSGHGKTSIISHLASSSYLNWGNSKLAKLEEVEPIRRRGSNLSHTSSPMVSRRHRPDGGSKQSSRAPSPASSLNSVASSRAGSMVSLIDDTSRKVASQVVSFHFCQADNRETCLLPEFLHNLIFRLTLAPQLASFKELIQHNLQLKSLASYQNCLINPVQVLREVVIQPLIRLRINSQIPSSNMFILVDGIADSKKYTPDHGYSILSFLYKYLPEFPDFLKVIFTSSNVDAELFQEMPLLFIPLDGASKQVEHDMLIYISHRISQSEILSTFTLAGSADPLVAQKQLTQHLMKKSQGNFLYLRMCLDFIDTKAIILKSPGFKVIPMNLHEVFLLLCNLNFRNYTSFHDVRDVMSIALASFRPLNDEELYQATLSGSQQLSWDDFNENMNLLEQILIYNGNTGRRSLFHPSLSDWFSGAGKRDFAQSSNRFLVDLTRGHVLLASMLSQQPRHALDCYLTIELAQHLIQSEQSTNQDSSPMQHFVHVMAQCGPSLTNALALPQMLLFPNIKVINLLLASGAMPNIETQILGNAPPLAVAASTGCLEVVELLLECGADVNMLSTNGMSPLSFASAGGHLNVVLFLLRCRPDIVKDHNNRTPLIHAIINDHSSVAKVLLSPNLYPTPHLHMMAVRQALVASAGGKSSELIEYLLEGQDYEFDVNFYDPINGESPLTAAATYGRISTCRLLLQKYGGNPNFPNEEGFTPLLCAIISGEWEVVDVLLNSGASIEATDSKGRSPLIVAACMGQSAILQSLQVRGANTNARDAEGLTALCWAAMKGHAHCVQQLIGSSNINHCDVHKRTALDLGVTSGNVEIVCLLVEAGADIRHCDVTGMTVLDRAISTNNSDMVSSLLRYGAEIQASSWVMASGKTDVMVALLKHSLEVGNLNYRRMMFSKASDVYSQALKRIGELSPDHNPIKHDDRVCDVCVDLLLSYSRCMRKMGKLVKAEKTASRALELKPNWCDALYARSRVARELGNLNAALCDVIEAERNAPPRNLREIRRLKKKLLEESGIHRGELIPPSSPEVNVPRRSYQVPPSYHSRNEGPPHYLSNISQSYDSRTSPLLTSDLNHASSQESLTQSLRSLSLNPENNHPLESSIYHSRYEPPRNQPPHWSEHSHSLSHDHHNT